MDPVWPEKPGLERVGQVRGPDGRSAVGHPHGVALRNDERWRNEEAAHSELAGKIGFNTSLIIDFSPWEFNLYLAVFFLYICNFINQKKFDKPSLTIFLQIIFFVTSFNLGWRLNLSVGDWPRHGARSWVSEVVGVRKSRRNHLG